MSHPPPSPPPPPPSRRGLGPRFDRVEIAILILAGAGITSLALIDWIAARPPAHAMRAPASPPVRIGQAGACPIFHSRGADGSDITILICAPGASPKEGR